MFAGSRGIDYGENFKHTSYYLYGNTGSSYWTLSPEGVLYGSYARNFIVGSSGGLYNGWYGSRGGDGNYDVVFTSNGVRPAISLISTISITNGEGTYLNPYKINI